MKASMYFRYGSPDVLEFREIPVPEPREDEVLIRVKAATVNRTDLGFLTADYFIVRFWSGLFRPKRPVLGCEFAGVVEKTGNGVKEYKAGDRVFGYNDVQFGAHAEYLVMKEGAAMALLPPLFSFGQAAPLTEGAHYALCDLRAAKIEAGQKILVNGATGAIGSAAVQLANYFGAEVTAVCNTPNTDLVASLGANVIIDYLKQDFTQLDQQFDIVFDAVGKSSFSRCRHLLKGKGIYMSTELGKMSQNPFLALVTPLSGGKKVLFPLPAISKDDVLFLKQLAETEKFKPVIDRYYSFSQIAEAFRYVATGQKTGNVILTMD
jgi:NADPH:quinone reductase-like Zn-dependent oxidoreductase